MGHWDYPVGARFHRITAAAATATVTLTISMTTDKPVWATYFNLTAMGAYQPTGVTQIAGTVEANQGGVIVAAIGIPAQQLHGLTPIDQPVLLPVTGDITIVWTPVAGTPSTAVMAQGFWT